MERFFLFVSYKVVVAKLVRTGLQFIYSCSLAGTSSCKILKGQKQNQGLAYYFKKKKKERKKEKRHLKAFCIRDACLAKATRVTLSCAPHSQRTHVYLTLQLKARESASTKSKLRSSTIKNLHGTSVKIIFERFHDCFD